MLPLCLVNKVEYIINVCVIVCSVQMSLHQPGDVVRMLDRGIAVQPGLRTLFELHYSHVTFS